MNKTWREKQKKDDIIVEKINDYGYRTMDDSGNSGNLYIIIEFNYLRFPTWEDAWEFTKKYLKTRRIR